MRIAVNTRLLLPDKLEGLGRFTCETLKQITTSHPEHEFVFIFDRAYCQDFIFSNNIIPVIAFPQARHPILWYMFFEWGVPHVLKRFKPELFLSPDGWLSLRARVPSLPVIHDLNFFHDPGWVESFPRLYYNHYFPRFIRKASRIATVSEYTKRDICSRFGIDPVKIDVVYNGVDEKFIPVAESVVQETRKKYTEGKPYFLFLGLVHPRKNLTRIIGAYNQYRLNSSESTKFLIAGSTKYWTRDTQLAYKNSPYKRDIVFIGRIQENELVPVVGSSVALVYASLFEGFGIPILEAMSCGVPVITSSTTSMPEVGGDAAYYVDPLSIDSIAKGMLVIAQDKKIRNNLIAKGFKQIENFSWNKTASLLWKSIETVVNGLRNTNQ
jgi:glycosyltransferase involved in cell wall biosynthesis